MRGIRLASVPYLNAYPLWQYLPHKPLFAPPSQLYRWMLQGECDVALLPTAVLARHPEWVIVSSTCIASEGPVESVKLFLRRPLADCRVIYLDTESLTSVALLKMIMLHAYHCPLSAVDFRDLKWKESFPDPADAVLLIGDKALGRHVSGWDELDLGEAWKAMTGLPFVYAAWITKEVPSSELSKQFEVSLEKSFQDIDTWLPPLAQTHDIPLADLRRYFEQSLQFHLTEQCRAGLDRFLKMMAVI